MFDIHAGNNVTDTIAKEAALAQLVTQAWNNDFRFDRYPPEYLFQSFFTMAGAPVQKIDKVILQQKVDAREAHAMLSSTAKVTLLPRLCMAELIDAPATARLRKLLSNEQRACFLRSICQRLPNGPFRHHNTAQMDQQVLRVSNLHYAPILNCPRCSIKFFGEEPHLTPENSGNVEHLAECPANENNRLHRELAWADSLRCHLPTYFFHPLPLVFPPTNLFITAQDPLPEGLDWHQDNPDLVVLARQYRSSPVPSLLLNALAMHWKGNAINSPREFVRDAFHLLRNAASPAQVEYEFRTLPPLLQRFFCSKLKASVVGQCVFTLSPVSSTTMQPPVLSATGLNLSQWNFPSVQDETGSGTFLAAISGASYRTLSLLLSRAEQVVTKGGSVLLAIEDAHEWGSERCCKECHVDGSKTMQLLSIPPNSFPLGKQDGFADDTRKQSGERTNTWRVLMGKLRTPAGYNTERLLRHPSMLSNCCIRFIHIRPRSTLPMLWQPGWVRELTEYIASLSYFPSQDMTPPPRCTLSVRVADCHREELGLNDSCAEHFCNDITLDPNVLLDTVWRRKPLQSLIPDVPSHFPMNPLREGVRLTAESMITATVLRSDTAVMVPLRLSQSAIQNVVAAVGHDLAAFDTHEEKAWVEDQYVRWAEQGVELRQLRTVAPATKVSYEMPPPQRTCALCDTAAERFYVLRPSDGSAATTLIRWAAKQWSLKALAAPTICPCKDKRSHSQACKDESSYREHRLEPAFMQTVAPGGVPFCYGCYVGVPPTGATKFTCVPSPLAQLINLRWPNFFDHCSKTYQQRDKHFAEIGTGLMPPPASPLASSPLTRTRSLPVPALTPPPEWSAPDNGTFTYREIRVAVLLDSHLASMKPLARVRRPTNVLPTLRMGSQRDVERKVVSQGRAAVVAFVGPSASRNDPPTDLFCWERLADNPPPKGTSLWGGARQHQLTTQEQPFDVLRGP